MTISSSDFKLETALRMCCQALRRLADYKSDASLDKRLQDVGERKEYLEAAEHSELMALFAFTQRRTMEKLEAQAGLQRSHELFGLLVHQPNEVAVLLLGDFGMPAEVLDAAEVELAFLPRKRQSSPCEPARRLPAGPVSGQTPARAWRAQEVS